MFKIPVSAFVLVPLLEICLLIKIGARIGAVSTLLLILSTTVPGAFLFWLQGLITPSRIREPVGRGELPAVSWLKA